MEMLLAILLWIGCISAPNTYTQSTIDTYATDNEPAITYVMGDQSQQTQIWNQYGVAVSNVNIIDPYR